MATYKQAIAWMVANDDTEWATATDEDQRTISITGALVADLFDKSDEQIRADIMLEQQIRRVRTAKVARRVENDIRPYMTADTMAAEMCGLIAQCRSYIPDDIYSAVANAVIKNYGR